MSSFLFLALVAENWLVRFVRLVNSDGYGEGRQPVKESCKGRKGDEQVSEVWVTGEAGNVPFDVTARQRYRLHRQITADKATHRQGGGE
jgi:hypothetical protein